MRDKVGIYPTLACADYLTRHWPAPTIFTWHMTSRFCIVQV